MSAMAASRIYARYDDSRKLYMPESPVVSGGKSGSYVFERQQVFSAGHTPTHAFDEHIFMLPLGDSAVPFTSRLNGRPLKGLIEPNRFRFLSAGDTLSTTWESPLEGIFVTLHPDVLHRALEEDPSMPHAELVSDVMPHRDDLLAHLTLAMQSYLLAGRLAGAIFEQSLLTAIAAHLVNAYSRGRRRSKGTTLTRRRRALAEEYIRQNLTRELNLGAIAAVVGMSPHQLARTFRATTGQSIWQHVIELRAREARRLMAASPSLSLSYVARASGFESYSQFIAAFRKFFGQLPSEYRRTHRR